MSATEMSANTTAPVDQERTRLRPRFSLLLLVGLVLMMSGFGAGARELYLAAGALVGLALLIGVDRGRVHLDVRVDRVIRVALGDTVTQTVTVSNPTATTSRPVSVHVSCPGMTDGVAWCQPLPPGASVTLTMTREALRRGVFHEVAGWLVSADALDLRRRCRPLPDTAVTIVQPMRVPPAQVTHWVDAGTRDLGGRHGTDLAGVRHWSPGDSRRAVHWRATARHGRLIVAERRDPLREALQVLVVGDRLGPQGEAQLATAASTAVAALSRGAEVTVIAVGAQGISVAPARAVTPMLDWFARVAGAATRPASPGTGPGRLEPATWPSTSAVARRLPVPSAGAWYVLGEDVPAGYVDRLGQAVPRSQDGPAPRSARRARW